MGEPVRAISTLQGGVSALGILAVGELLVRDPLGAGIPAWLGLLAAFGIVTHLTVVLGELVPKAIALDRAEAIAVSLSRPLELTGMTWTPGPAKTPALAAGNCR